MERTATLCAEEVNDHVAAFCALAQAVPENVVLATLGAMEVAAKSPVKATFMTRVLHAMARLAEVSTQNHLQAVVTAATDTMVLVEALDNKEVLAEIGPDDPLVEARIRGILAQRFLLSAEGGVCSANELGQLLGGITRQAVDNRRKSGKLIALNLGKHGFAYPAWQVHDGTVLPGLEQVIAELDECDPWTQVGFMLNPNSWLNGETPLAVLRRGGVERVVATARMFGD